MHQSSRSALMALASVAVSLFAGAAQATCPTLIAPAKSPCTYITFEKTGAAVPVKGVTAATITDNPKATATNAKALWIMPATDGSSPLATTKVYTFDDPRAPQSVNPAIGLNATRTKILVWAFSAEAGRRVGLQVWNVTETNSSVYAEAFTTKSGVWEPLVFDFAATAPSATTLYNRLIIELDGASSSIYFDNIVYPAGKKLGPPPPCNSGGKVTLMDGMFASGYADKASLECGDYGFDAGDHWGLVLSKGVETGTDPNFYFSYNMKRTAVGLGGVVRAPKNGWVVVNTASTATVDKFSSMTLGVWGNAPLFNTKPPVRVLITSAPVPPKVTTDPMCTPAIYATIDTNTSAAPAAASYYTLNFADFKLLQACGAYNTPAKILTRGVASVSAGVTAPYLYFDAGKNAGTNQMNIGTIKFNP
jgi:hypothetical protein